MVFVSRDTTGALNGVFAVLQPGLAEEFLVDTDPVVVAFLTPRVVDFVDGWDLVSLRIAFNHENRIRALEGKAPVTVVQFKTAIRGLL